MSCIPARLARLEGRLAPTVAAIRITRVLVGGSVHDGTFRIVGTIERAGP